MKLFPFFSAQILHDLTLFHLIIAITSIGVYWINLSYFFIGVSNNFKLTTVNNKEVLCWCILSENKVVY